MGRRGSKMEDLLERPVGVAQEPGVLPGVDPGGRAVAQRTQHAVALLCGRLSCGRCRDADGVGEHVEIGGIGGGVNALHKSASVGTPPRR